ncbi:MAG: WYL domain-containing protein [Oscillospiraceae bacterium]|nr:WYL domain-containing protein [Oscillospiraceae bacterium]
MSKTEGQRERLIMLYRILRLGTDREHLISMQSILQQMEEQGIPAERRSIYCDLQALNDCGIEVETIRGPKGGYRLKSRPFSFEVSDLKLMTDAVASAKFLTEDKSRMLVQKIESMASRYDAAQLQRQVYVVGRVRSENEQTYDNVDVVHHAIAQNEKISFRYFHYDAKKQRIYKYDGAANVVSPYALCWDNEFYYLLAWYDRTDEMRNFRVDRMENVLLLQQKAKPAPPSFNPTRFTRRAFSMYNGRKENVTLEFKDALAGTVLDRFGMETSFHRADIPGWFRIVEDVHISPPFLGWLAQFAGSVRVISPKSVQEELRQQAEEVLNSLPESTPQSD